MDPSASNPLSLFVGFRPRPARVGPMRPTHLCLPFLLACSLASHAYPQKQPNIILVITDDQGYGDLGAHGNSMIRTPHMDRLHAESVRLTDFHVDPTCAPTRAALMSGRDSTRTGVWHTIMGRSLMDSRELTLAEVFRSAGYKTGQFGKWHLGDNAPLRPQDQGFDEAFYHKGGGIGQGPDAWGNDYFDDTYFRNGKREEVQGYCTDVWFDNALDFIERSKDQPFFAYLATNAPHAPYLVEESEVQPYLDAGVAPTMAKFYGMITRIDRNLGKLRRRLRELEIADNTILIFMTDNGSAAGTGKRAKEKGSWLGFNAGMRAGKGSEYDGGHRVPFFLHWPAGGFDKGRNVGGLTAHIDVLPTLVDLCGIQKPDGPPLDGIVLSEILRGKQDVPAQRTLFIHSQRIPVPEPWRKTAVLRGTQRLIRGEELYDLASDPGQRQNLAEQQGEDVKSLTKAYESWWSSLAKARSSTIRISIGHPAETRAALHSHDWHAPTQNMSPWHQNHVTRGQKTSSPWEVHVERAGRYRIELRRWADHLNLPLGAVHARIRVGAIEAEQALDPQEPHASFELNLPKGPASLQSWLQTSEGEVHGAYYAYVNYIGPM